MTQTSDIVAKLWNLCHILRDGGISYHQYVTELTLLLFLKMAKETGKERTKEGAPRIPKGCRWDDFLALPPGGDKLDAYKEMLIKLGKAPDPLVRAIYTGAQTTLREARHLDRLVLDIDGLDWFTAKSDGLGDMYEGLLEKNASETKSGAGQYFTPRPLIEAMVDVMKPQAGEVVQDPAAGTAGFLIAADTYIKKHTADLFDLGDKEQRFQKREAFVGLELVPETRRLALMNCMLHDIDGVGEGAVRLGDTLSSDGAKLPDANLIMTNPPFGTKKGAGGGSRDDLTFPTSNKQLMFLQHIYRALVPGGRAAVVLPDNVLFEEGRGREIRTDLMDKCNLHTILRLPTGIFYAQGVKTNVLFFTRGEKEKGNTKKVWVYDLRTNAPAFGKRTPFTREYLQPFVHAFGADPTGAKNKRKDEGEQGRFRAFTREDIAKRNDNLDLSWLKDDSAHDETTLGEPDEIAAEIRVELQAALEDLAALEELLGATSPSEAA
ncbi:MAG: N-6 DNA methylase [Kofleriaceae bacterium]|nr:N-6 DNA methylase [Kofleriaceae bacterium]